MTPVLKMGARLTAIEELDRMTEPAGVERRFQSGRSGADDGDSLALELVHE